MTASSTDGERRVVPRWRPFRVTLSLRELSTAFRPTPSQELRMALSATKRDWLDRRNVENAIEFIHTAALLDRLEEAQDAIDLIVAAEELPEFVKQSTALQDDEVILADVPLDARARIAQLKTAVRNWPRDATLWTDLALLYCTVGLDEKANKCLLVARNIVPDNRYVLRCSTRFYIHNDDPEGAIYLLRRSARGNRDPWLVAAEIAASQIAGRASKFSKAGLRLLESQRFSNGEISELAASLGTVEVKGGKMRKAKRLFEVSARLPNDNVKAQFQWLRGAHRDALPSRRINLNGRLDHEARAWDHQKAEKWQDAINSCWQWGADEPFSDRPYLLGSYIAIEALGDAAQAEKLARKGLLANAHETYLHNNLAVSLAYQGRLDDAEESWRAARRGASRIDSEGTLRATAGLLHYRRGDVEAGRREYVAAIRAARTSRDEDAARRAAVYLVLEEVVAETAESGLLAEFLLARVNTLAPETRRFANQIRRMHSHSATGAVDIESMNTLRNLVDWSKG